MAINRKHATFPSIIVHVDGEDLTKIPANYSAWWVIHVELIRRKTSVR